MKKKYAALMVAAAIMAVPGTLAMAASPNTTPSISHGGGGGSSHSSSRSAGLNVSSGTITNKTATGVKNDGQNGSNGISVSNASTGAGATAGTVSFSSDQQIRDNNSVTLAEKVFEINAGVALYRATGDPAIVGYSPLMPAQQLISTNAAGAVTKDPVTVNVSVAALGNAQNIQIYYYNETAHQWQLAPVNAVDYATNTVNITVPGNAIFTLVHKN